MALVSRWRIALGQETPDIPKCNSAPSEESSETRVLESLEFGVGARSGDTGGGRGICARQAKLCFFTGFWDQGKNSNQDPHTMYLNI